jgi:hypothetical protein
VFWYVCGVDITRPSTYGKYPAATAITGFLTSGTLIVASIFPTVFEFNWPPLNVIALIVTLWMLSSLVTSIGMRNRALLNQLYELMDSDKQGDSKK